MDVIERQSVMSALLMNNNIISENNYIELVEHVLKKVSDAIACTLGPGGSFTFLNDLGSGEVLPSKDGYRVMEDIKFMDQNKMTIYKVIKDISFIMNTSVGDGTTTGIVIAEYMYTALRELRESLIKEEIYLTPIAMRQLMEVLKNEISSIINDSSNGYKLDEKVFPDEKEWKETSDYLLERTATISANNDNEVGTIVSDLFKRRETDNVYVTAEDGYSETTEIKTGVGFEFGTGLLDITFANQPDRTTCKLIDPRFLLVDGPITDNDWETVYTFIKYVCVNLDKPLVIIAADYPQNIKNKLINLAKGGVTKDAQRVEPLPLLVLPVNTQHEVSRERMEDLRILLDGEPFPTAKGQIMRVRDNTVESFEKYLGSAKEIYSHKLGTRILGGDGDKTAIRSRIEDLEQKIQYVLASEDPLVYSTEAMIKKRIAMLNSDMSVIKIGGANDKERQAKKLLYDDAIAACQASLKSGFTLGGNGSVVHSIKNKRSIILGNCKAEISKGAMNISLGNTEGQIDTILNRFLDIIGDSFTIAYKRVVSNMIGNTDTIGYIIDSVYKQGQGNRIYNLASAKLDYLSEIDLTDKRFLAVAGNTDTMLMSAIFGTVGLLLSSNAILSAYAGDAVVSSG